MIKDTIPNGVYPTMITPYTADNKVDYDAVERLLNWYSEKGCDGVFAICQSSEIFFLSFEERLELVKFIMKHAPKNLSIVASGHTADDIDTQIYEAKAFCEAGFDAYVFIANRFADKDEDDTVFLKNYEKAVKEIGDIAYGIYECPHPYKRLMAPETLRRCAEISPMRFIKDTCCDVKQIKAKYDAVEGTGLKIFNANSATLLETLKMGCAGFSGVMANFHPEIYAWLCKNWDKEPEKAKLASDFLAFASVAECRCYPVCAKYHMNLVGVPMEIDARACDKNNFIDANKLEFEGLVTLENIIKEKLGIN